MFVTAACSLQGCVAAIPLAVAGVIGKKHLDSKKPADNAQATMPAQPKPFVAQETEVAPGGAANPAGALADTRHPYARMVQYALDRAAARAAGEDVRSAVLVEGVSLADPRTVPCGDKPLAVIIDMDAVPGAAQLTQSGLATLLDSLRSADIRIAWMGNGSIAAIEAILTQPNVAEYSLLSQRDDILSAPEKGPRKQEQRWAFAKGHCVLATAGDRKSDFDELFDYLRDPAYAAPLETFNDHGWFIVPSPLRINVEKAP